jgi:hypothetical protein
MLPLLLLTALAAVIRSSQLPARSPVALTALALMAIVAGGGPARDFVGHAKNGSSLAMALTTALAILCYALVLFLLGISPRPASGGSDPLEVA